MKPLIVANWKCNPTSLKEAKKLFNSVKRGIKNTKKVEVVICPPFVYLAALKANGAQDAFWEQIGAFTGEVSPKMLKDLGCQYVIIGHSERRRHQKETDEMINKKIKAVLRERLKPVLCIDNIKQIKKDLKGINKEEIQNLVIAYEPLFAIGTGKSCNPEKAEKMRILIKKILKKNIRIIYGGSLNSQNARDYIKKAGFQGLLPGGVSLNPKEFVELVKNIDFIARTC